MVWMRMLYKEEKRRLEELLKNNPDIPTEELLKKLPMISRMVIDEYRSKIKDEKFKEEKKNK